MEYIKLEPSEQVYVKRSLLYSEMEILNIIKGYKEFLKLRKLELSLKTTLRKKIKDVKEEMTILDKLLPKVKESHSDMEKLKSNYPKKRQDLEQEIQDIQRKLAELQ